MGAGTIKVVGKFIVVTRQWLLEAWLIGSWHKALVIVFLFTISAGCVNPASLAPGTPKVVAVTVAPTAAPTPAPEPTALPSPTLSPGVVASGTLTQATAPPANEEWLYRTYAWDYKGVQWNFNVKISKTIYEFYRNHQRGTGQNYADYALTAEDRPFLDDITAQLKSNGQSYGYTGLDDVMNVLTFVQSLGYEEDTGSDYTRYPLETLADEKGDCKDKSILGAAMLHEMGYDVVLLKFPQHMALGIRGAAEMQGACYEYGGKKYYYVETTSPNWGVGDIPGDLKGQTPVIISMSNSPTIDAALDVKAAGAEGHDSNYKVSCTIKNTGPGTAANLTAHVYALALERGQGRIWMPDRIISIGDYGAGHEDTIETTLTVYAGEKTQIYCVITGDNVETSELKTSVFYG